MSLPWLRRRGGACAVGRRNTCWSPSASPTAASLPRVASCVEAYPGRWTHHVVVASEEELDDELMALIDEAYQFSMVK